MTMTLISTLTVGAGGAANIDFTSIPSTFTDLQLVLSLRSTASGTYGIVRIALNSTSTGFSNRQLIGTGSSTLSFTGTDDQISNANGASTTTNTFSNLSIYFPNYTSSVAKAFSSDLVVENNATAGRQQLTAHLWTGTAAISSIRINADGNNFVENSTASLYGILKGTGGANVS
jgi:hypothetical protein